MERCIYCNAIQETNLLNLFNKNKFCIKCFNKLTFVDNKIIVKTTINNSTLKVSYLILFEYCEFSKDYLYAYKRKGDIILCTLFEEFLNYYFNNNFDYKKSFFTYVSSSEKSFSKRLFTPTEEFLKLIKGIDIIHGPKRLDNIRQGSLSFQKRRKQHHVYNEIYLPLRENLIIFEDVISTGTTIHCYLNHILNIEKFNNVYVVSLFGSKNLNLSKN